MRRLVLLRHGESVWNKENRFTGWTDVDLSERGVNEAREAGRILKENGIRFDAAYTSVLKRAIRTLWLVLDEMDLMWIPVTRDWRLNERHYGALQGLDKADTSEKFGRDQVMAWRRSYDTPPPLLNEDDERFPGKDRKYLRVPPSLLPKGECLQDTVARVIPCWEGVISGEISSGRTILISAHGNSLRALVKYLDNIPDSEITGLNIPTGIPLVYELDDGLRPLRHYYIGDPEKIREGLGKAA